MEAHLLSNIGSKQCTGECNEIRPLNDFYFDSTNGCYEKKCKSCRRKSRTQRYKLCKAVAVHSENVESIVFDRNTLSSETIEQPGTSGSEPANFLAKEDLDSVVEVFRILALWRDRRNARLAADQAPKGRPSNSLDATNTIK